jgi:LysR family transcriptional regulator, regulator of abg operon
LVIIKVMKIANLQALVAAIDHGSLRHAARNLGLTQPALSKSIRDLEMELGTRLLLRNSRGVFPTAQGQVLNQHALAVLRELAVAQEQLRLLSGDLGGELSVAAVPLAMMLLIPEALRTFGQEYSEVKLNVSEELYMAQLQRLRKGDVDVAIGGIPQGLPTGEFRVESLVQTTMVVVVRKGSRRAYAQSLVELADAKWVYTAANLEQGYAKLLFESHGLTAPRVGAVVNSTLALLALVTSADYVGLMPEQIMRHSALSAFLTVVPIREKGLPLDVAVMVKSDTSVKPIVRHFIAHLHRAAHHLAMGNLPI